ncbi:MAG: FHA domain-containing protein, partial [Ilumatobacteraceae bacterium]
EISIDADTAVSRQHAQLIATSSAGDGAATDAQADAYAAVDLGSTNGTFIVPAGAAPDVTIEPIAPGVPVVLTDGDQLYLGAWSRLTVRYTGA